MAVEREVIPSWDTVLALSHVKRRAVKRRHSNDLVTTQDRIGREFLVTRRLSSSEGCGRNWASSWALERYPERSEDAGALSRFLRLVRRWAARLEGAGFGPRGRPGPESISACTRLVKRCGNALDEGVCTRALRPSERRRRHGAGGPGVMHCPEIAAELFAWLVDSIRNIKGRVPSFLLLDVAHGFGRALSQGHEQDKEHGIIPPHTALHLPKLDYCWLRRWRRLHHVTWRTVNLRFKCSRAVLMARLLVFCKNVLRVRFLHGILEPQGDLVFEGMDQKPLWFTAASQERTLALRGARKVAVKENVPMTRARFTAMTRCRWPTPPTDNKELGILFRAAGGGSRIRETLRVPPGVLLQFQERGSYRLSDVLEYFEWILDRSRIAAHAAKGCTLPAIQDHAGQEDGFEPREKAADCPALLGEVPLLDDGAHAAGRRVVYLLDWFAPHLDSHLDDLVHAAGHAILRIGGYLTGLVQVEDTHAHGPYSKEYKRQETEDAYDQLKVRPDRLPSTSRQTVMDRALLAWSHVDHESCSKGFVGNGIANALDGSEDGELTEDVTGFWQEMRMSEVREAVRVEVVEVVGHGRVSRFEDYFRLFEPYPAHAAMK